jgi:chloride channel protein, CIC family
MTLLLAVLIGVVTGLLVAGFEQTVHPAYEWVAEQPLWSIALITAGGFVVVNLIAARSGGGDTATTDAYVRAYHQRGGRMALADGIRKVVMSAISLGTGGALGYEGPSMLIGGTVGSSVDARFAGRFRRDDAKVLMVAGAAAGVAAIFKAPLTGVVFALEVPYRSDLARRALASALAAAGSAYVTYVAIVGTEPILATGGAAPFDLRDLGGGLLLGLACGVLARLGAWAIGRAKHLPLSRVARTAMGAVGMVALLLLSDVWFSAPVSIGPGYAAIDYATAMDRTALVLVALFAVRAAATWLSVGAGGVGGLFIPLVTQGAILGALVQHMTPAANATLFPTIGVAAFLGAGYRTPLAGVAFVAEATGQPGFLVPALLAAVAAQLAMGHCSFSAYQRGERAPDVEPLTSLTVGDIMSANPDTVDAHRHLDDVATTMMGANRRWAPVVDDGRYVGLVAVTDIAATPVAEWATTEVATIVRTDIVPAAPDDAVSDVATRLRHDDGGAVAVTADGRVIGVVTRRDLENVEVLLDRLTGDSTTP